ncbi:hypothetical protein NUACC26_044620 [Scytonema sp. NUACC26]
MFVSPFNISGNMTSPVSQADTKSISDTLNQRYCF